jgi:aarF domain-containing kinase
MYTFLTTYIELAQTCVGTGYLPDEYSDKFEVLLDQCPSRGMDVIAKVFEQDVGCTLDDAFATFDTTPIGAGSIGQVHRATLKGSGKPVVVKIQYPGVEEYFHLDFQTMTWL